MRKMPKFRKSARSWRCKKTTQIWWQRSTPKAFANLGRVEKTVELTKHIYEIRQRRDRRGVDLLSDALPFGRLRYGEPHAVASAIGYAKFFSRSHVAVIRVYDAAGSVVETHEHAGRFQKLVTRVGLLAGSQPLARR